MAGSSISLTRQIRSVHEVSRPPTQVQFFAVLEGKLNPGQPDQQDVESLEEEDEEEEPEGPLIVLAVRLVDVVHLVEVGDPLGQTMNLHLRCKQNQNQTAAETCGRETTSL